jgi:hypothetical protein
MTAAERADVVAADSSCSRTGSVTSEGRTAQVRPLAIKAAQ